MNLIPFADRVVVKRDEAENVTKGGIHLPDQAKERPVRGKVLAVGPGKRDPHTGNVLAMTVKEGDRVLFGNYAGNEVNLDGEKITVMREDDLLGIIK